MGNSKVLTERAEVCIKNAVLQGCNSLHNFNQNCQKMNKRGLGKEYLLCPEVLPEGVLAPNTDVQLKFC